MQVMPFGKYKGQPIENLPKSYLSWLWFNSAMIHGSPQLRYSIGKALGLPVEIPFQHDSKETLDKVKQVIGKSREAAKRQQPNKPPDGIPF